MGGVGWVWRAGGQRGGKGDACVSLFRSRSSSLQLSAVSAHLAPCPRTRFSAQRPDHDRDEGEAAAAGWWRRRRQHGIAVAGAPRRRCRRQGVHKVGQVQLQAVLGGVVGGRQVTEAPSGAQGGHHAGVDGDAACAGGGGGQRWCIGVMTVGGWGLHSLPTRPPACPVTHLGAWHNCWRWTAGSAWSTRGGRVPAGTLCACISEIGHLGLPRT